MLPQALDRDGAARIDRVFGEAEQALLCRFVGAGDRTGSARLFALPTLLTEGPLATIARDVLGPGARAVRALLLDKTPAHNWPLGWHQDRTIAVSGRMDVAGFDRWTVKDKVQHVEPPFAVIERMVTMRVHLDPVGPDNASLLVALGSHRHGRVPVEGVDRVVRQGSVHACLAEAGTVWIYATSILHASDRAAVPGRRRVLQLDWSADSLSEGLEWAGIDDADRAEPLERRAALP